MTNNLSTIDYKKRRESLLQQTKNEKAIIIVPSAPIANRNADMDYVYRQDSDFYYLTGFEEPESILVLSLANDKPHFILFNRPNDPLMETWHGKRAGQQGAREIFGADESYPIEEFASKLPELLKDKNQILLPLSNQNLDKKVKKTIINQVMSLGSDVAIGLHAPISITDVSPNLAAMRQIKEAAEMDKIRKAVDISEQAHLKAMKRVQPGVFEYQLEAELMHTYLDNGAHAPAYPNIVASGENTCILHYEENNQKIQDGDLVLIDAAAEYSNYAADITRTFPANGKFTPEQRAVYEIVLKAQEAGIKEVYPGSTWAKVSDAAAKIITQGLLDLGLLTGELDDLLQKKAYLPFYMHGVGHWVGLDTHDVGSYFLGDRSHRTPFQPGMVLTVEPGIYISSKIPNVPQKWHNIGVRIEDDILVTPTGNEVLSSHVPKQVDEIEALINKKLTNDKESVAPGLTTTAKLAGILGKDSLNRSSLSAANDVTDFNQKLVENVNAKLVFEKSARLVDFKTWERLQNQTALDTINYNESQPMRKRRV